MVEQAAVLCAAVDNNPDNVGYVSHAHVRHHRYRCNNPLATGRSCAPGRDRPGVAPRPPGVEPRPPRTGDNIRLRVRAESILRFGVESGVRIGLEAAPAAAAVAGA